MPDTKDREHPATGTSLTLKRSVRSSEISMERFMRVVKAASLALAVTLAAGGIAFADQDVPGADWMPK